MNSRPSSSIAIPVAIVTGFALIAAAIYFAGIGSRSLPKTPSVPVVSNPSIKAVDETDMIRGNPNAPIMIVEYSDYECPFCKVFHETMRQIIEEYGLTGKVAWVYRQMPFVQIHPNAPRLSEAALCVADIGGTKAFWTFSDALFDSRPEGEQTTMSRLPEFVSEAGVEISTFNACLSSGKMTARVNASVEEGFNAGVTGTPHSVILVGNQQALIEGAQDYTTIKLIIDSLIGQLENAPPTALPTPESDS